eukprot:9404740-Pyramimonas_sp.AAC.1
MALLSDGPLEVFTDIMKVAEALGEPPPQIPTAIMPRLPRPESGHRLIGPLADTLRIHNKCHKRSQYERLGANVKSHHYAVARRSPGQAAWTQSVMDEAGLALKRHTDTVTLDLEKAFEKIPNAKVWE